jgi:hypothetical protein
MYGCTAARLLGYGGLESLQELACLFLVSVVCCQLEGSATGRSFVQGVLPSVECLSVTEEPHIGDLGQLGSSIHEGKGEMKNVSRHRNFEIIRNAKLVLCKVLRRFIWTFYVVLVLHNVSNFNSVSEKLRQYHA